ncbi:MAG: Hsp20/alpha crystallin family protein [Bacillaceae bacterium]
MFGITPFNRRTITTQRTNDPFMEMFNVMDNFFGDRMRPLMNDTFKVDVKENDDAYLIEAEMPGVKKEDIQLDYGQDILTINVKHEEEVNDEKDNYVHRERHMSSMQRSIQLPNMNHEAIKAKLEDGVLKIVVPKVEIAPPKNKIEIE